MEIQDVINRVEIYGFESAVRGSKYPMAVNLSQVTEEVVPRTFTLAKAVAGSGHDNFLNGIIVQNKHFFHVCYQIHNCLKMKLNHQLLDSLYLTA